MAEISGPDGRRWRLRRRRIDLRIVKRLIRRPDVVVLVAEAGGARLRPVTAGERGDLWEAVRRAYAGPGGHLPPGRPYGSLDYLAHEYTRHDDPDDGAGVMLYLEEHC